jgi:hypothetical protein
VRAAIEAHREYVQGETLCTELDFAPSADGAAADLNGHTCHIEVAAVQTAS